jgi:hypothetical protein
LDDAIDFHFICVLELTTLWQAPINYYPWNNGSKLKGLDNKQAMAFAHFT